MAYNPSAGEVTIRCPKCLKLIAQSKVKIHAAECKGVLATIEWTDPGFSESHLRGYYIGPWSFEETVGRLIATSGQQVKSFDEYKSSVDFVGIFAGQRFTLYDYKEDRQIHIGGSDALDVANFVVALTQALEVVEPAAYKAKEYYDKRKGHSYGK